jgi:hypothetical protein
MTQKFIFLMRAGGAYRKLYQYQNELEQYSCLDTKTRTDRRAAAQ